MFMKRNVVTKAFKCLFSRGKGTRARYVSTCSATSYEIGALRKKTSSLHKRWKIHITFWKREAGCFNLWFIFFRAKFPPFVNSTLRSCHGPSSVMCEAAFSWTRVRFGSEMDRERKKSESVCGETAYLAQGIPYLVEHRSDNSNFSILGGFNERGDLFSIVQTLYFDKWGSLFENVWFFYLAT